MLPHERVHAGFDAEKIVAGTGAFDFDLTIPGGQVKAAGVTVTGVLPTHRRRGYLRALQRSLIDDARARGEPVAVLWATEDTIYGQFGYGMASMAAEIDVPRDRTAPFAPNSVRADVRLVPLKEAEPLIAPIYESVARVTPGMFARTSEWWQDRVLNDMEWKRRGGGFLQCAVLEIGGTACRLCALSDQFRLRARRADRQHLCRRGDGGLAGSRRTRSGAFSSTSTGSHA